MSDNNSTTVGINILDLKPKEQNSIERAINRAMSRIGLGPKASTEAKAFKKKFECDKVTMMTESKAEFQAHCLQKIRGSKKYKKLGYKQLLKADFYFSEKDSPVEYVVIGPVEFAIKKGAEGYNIWLGNTFYDSCGVNFTTSEEAYKALKTHFKV